MLIDVAELDDISAVVLMALLFSLLPVLTDKTGGPLMPVVARTLGVFLAKLIGFGVCCYLFSRYAEKPITARFKNMNPPSSYMLVVLAIGFIIAAAADMLGFSMAIGAFFAGLVFSRDPEAVKRETSFMPLYELFSPFFFIGIGMSMDPESLHGAAGLGAILLLAAMISKMLADGLPAWMMGTFSSGALIGISMIPRAEIAMVIMHRGLYLKNQAVSAEVFGAMVMVSLGTCLIAPLCVKPLLQKWPQPEEK
jgi:Kef-type K+ transport system membrane component KefB